MLACHLLSLNVRGLRNKDKISQIFRWARHQETDILLLQETFWSPDLENIIKNEWHGHCFFSHGSNHSRGVAILFQQRLEIEDVNVIIYGNDGRLLMLKVGLPGMKLLLVNVYAPTEKKNRERFFFVQ